MARHPTARSGRRLRVGLLVAVALATAAAARVTNLGAHPVGALRIPATPVWLVVLGGSLVAFAALVGSMLRFRRHRPDDLAPLVPQWRATRRAKAVALLVGLLVAAAPLVVLAAVGGHLTPGRGSTHESPGQAQVSPTGHGGHGVVSTSHSLSVLLGVALLAGAAGVWLLTRRSPAAVRPEDEPDEGLVTDALRATARAGAVALDRLDDVRQAVVDCYRVMQRSLEGAGLRSSPVRTPSELLAAAVQQRLAPLEPADTLTRLFERARFSTEPMTESDRDSARAALQVLQSGQVSPCEQ